MDDDDDLFDVVRLSLNLPVQIRNAQAISSFMLTYILRL